jgi:tRNA 2-thiouridine synthesizing protein C
MKKYLFIIKKAAHSGAYMQEILDMLLTTAAFEQSVTVLLLDDALFALKRNQHALALKDTAALFEVLPMYEVTDIYVETESLQARGLQIADLLLPVQPLARAELGAFSNQFDVLVPC